jgi:2-dehydro-3-deoxygluconokinase
MADLVSIGECMIELSRQPDGRFSLAYGGDTFNTAVYAARLGLSASYAMALGDDPYSDGIIAAGGSESVDMTAIPRLKGRVPGLYIIETDARGERSFFYWRDAAPARVLFELPERQTVIDAMTRARLVYFSGITLSLYGEAGLDAFEAALRAAKAAGARIAFDGNFRPRGWRHDLDRARSVFLRFLPMVDIALPTFDDEQALWGDTSPQATLDRLSGLGIATVAVKNGREGALVSDQGQTVAVPVPRQVQPVDTTAAGDSFNAAFLAALLNGAAPAAAARSGHELAAIVIAHRGAIVPREATNELRLWP